MYGRMRIIKNNWRGRRQKTVHAQMDVVWGCGQWSDEVAHRWRSPVGTAPGSGPIHHIPTPVPAVSHRIVLSQKVRDRNYLGADVASYQTQDSVKMLYIIGLGLADEKDISVKGLDIVRKAERVYLEAYTAVLLVEQSQLVGEV